jgi:transposase
VAVRFLQENPVPRKEKGAPVSRCAFAFPLRCGHFCTVPPLRTASRSSQSPIRSRSSRLAEFALKAHAFDNPEARDDAPLNFLAGLASSHALEIDLRLPIQAEEGSRTEPLHGRDRSCGASLSLKLGWIRCQNLLRQGIEQACGHHPQVRIHFTPTYSSWLNQVEIWFAKIQRQGHRSRHLYFRRRSPKKNPSLHSSLQQNCYSHQMDLLYTCQTYQCVARSSVTVH